MNGVALGLVFASAAAISAGIIMALLPLLQRYALAHPNSRSSHRQSTPQGGGIAVITATIGVGAAAVAIGLRESPLDPATLWAVFAATAFMAFVGAIDDIRTIEVAPRLLLQILAVGIVLATLPAELRVVPELPWWIERALLLLACLWFVNLTNFMDGIDWMTIAEFIPMAIGLVLIGFLGALPMHCIVVALALCGGPHRLCTIQPAGGPYFPWRCRQPSDRPPVRLAAYPRRGPRSPRRRLGAAALLSRRCDADAAAPD